MTLRDELSEFARKTHRTVWSYTDGRSVPDTESISLGNSAVKLNATVLYADLAESTKLVVDQGDMLAAEVYKNYLYAASRLIRERGGTITAFDGDRVMGIFIGDSQKSAAAKCALQINYVTRKLLQPAFDAVYTTNSYTYRHKVGVDSSSLFVARTGIRGSNDLVWVGEAANNAAKMAALPDEYSSYISEEVYANMNTSSRMGGKAGETPRDMWTPLGDVLDAGYNVYGSRWTWSI